MSEGCPRRRSMGEELTSDNWLFAKWLWCFPNEPFKQIPPPKHLILHLGRLSRQSRWSIGRLWNCKFWSESDKKNNCGVCFHDRTEMERVCGFVTLCEDIPIEGMIFSKVHKEVWRGYSDIEERFVHTCVDSIMSTFKWI